MMTAATLLLKTRSLPIPLRLTIPFAASIHQLLSSTITADNKAAPAEPQFSAVDYLTRSLGLPPDVAARASKKIQHFASPDRPDAVLQFLRRAGVSEPSIRTAVRRDASILCSTVERNWNPNFAKLRELGLSKEDISRIVAHDPKVFTVNFVPKVDYLLRVLGSAENVSAVLRRGSSVLIGSLEKVIIPNFAIFRDQLGLSVAQIVRLVAASPRLARSTPESLKVLAKRAEELGVRCSSPMFPYALVVVSGYNQQGVNVRVNNLKSLGFSQEEVTAIVSKLPLVLTLSVEMIGRKVEFMMKQVACDKLQLVHNPVLFTLSLEKRLVPRCTVRKLLLSKGLPAGSLSLASFVKPTEKEFLEKFVLPHEHTIPGLHRAYTDACAGNVR